MKQFVWTAACAGLLLATTSCLNTEKEMSNSRNSDRPFVATPEGARARVTERTVLRTVNATHYFSNTKTKDQFILQLRGPKILESQARLIILTSTGDTLRREQIPATALLDERTLDAPQATTVRDKEMAILQGMNAFFREDKFTQPAIARKSTVVPANIDQQSWQTVREDNRAVGFDYIADNGKERRLAYSKKLQKAVVIAQ